MDYKDLILTPIYLIIVYIIAYRIRPKVTNKLTKRYFIPAITVKLFGAIGVGCLYFFYYGGGEPGGTGDTFNYFKESSVIHEAILESPTLGLKILFKEAGYDPEAYKYISRIDWYDTTNNFFVIQTATIFGLLSFNTYTIIAIFFALLSFSGLHALYIALLKIFPKFHKELATGVFFVPSLFFWGSGLMKDTICIGALGWAFWAFHKALIQKSSIITTSLILLLSLITIQIVKTYILLCFVPSAILWIFMENNKKIKNKILKAVISPILIIGGIGIGYIAGTNLTEGSEYDVENVAETAATTSNYLERQTARKAVGARTGSTYTVGKLDGTIQSMITAAPQAILVSLYRPFLFEVRNPVMLLAAIETSWLLITTLIIFWKRGFIKTISTIRKNPLLTFCLVFTLTFAIGVGLTSGNYGTLVRYRTPLIPFFVTLLMILKKTIRRKS
ncbi:hypothetical protein TH61_11460 [Rufibacter sp. DG15C]|uniref:hypothetical protein n=1 Tax=Rufibacter sp. DG15C TaxID=1379909 RepID=UPI00078C1F8E|nr:hypothetical protein [Rufibacter sp. DG15C]AMM51672.1 hypothetical protein TH61_11460 [Rufibacter sp. DG15C]